MSQGNHNYPVIVGVSQLTHRPRSVAEALEPMELMVRVAQEAEADAGCPGLLQRLDSVQVVNIIGWSYADAPGTLAARLGASPCHTFYSGIGGETPQRLINNAAADIVAGRRRLVLIAGAEALESRRLARKSGERLPWAPRATPTRLDDPVLPGFNEVEARHGCTLPIHFYPLFENALRAHKGLTLDEHRRRLGELCSRMSAVAANNPYAWFPIARSPQEITTVSPANRMVCFPYPKLMNAIIEVDQAAAIIVTGAETARDLGVPEERWVYLHGCGDATDKWFVSERRDYYSSPGIEVATRRALAMAGVTVEEIAFFDLYSCFPSAVQLAMDALGLAPEDPRGVTVTGGLPYAGGPGNNYVSHSVATMVGRLREAPEKLGLVTGLGWFVTKHSAGVYGARPPAGSWQRTDPALDQAALDAMPSPPLVEAPEGAATVETYTVVFSQAGEPERGIVVGRLDSGQRFFANTEPDRSLLEAMCRREFVGQRGLVRHDAASGRNVFLL